MSTKKELYEQIKCMKMLTTKWVNLIFKESRKDDLLAFKGIAIREALDYTKVFGKLREIAATFEDEK